MGCVTASRKPCARSTRDRRQSAYDVSVKLYERYGIAMSRTTVWRCLVNDLRLVFHTKIKKPCKGDPVKRLKFARFIQELIEKENPVFIWTDGKYAGTHQQQRGEYCDETQTPGTNPKERWMPKVHTRGPYGKVASRRGHYPKGRALEAV